ncbi:MAG TPA: FAD-dependent oxidoreductase, partial [Burkholderiales bacterium]|nr:FAD-dependent oxidoreductase [Burkholderiales bacterium]
NAEISLVDPAQYTTYSGMLPGLIAGHYSFDDCHIDLRRLTQRSGVRFCYAGACGIDSARRQVMLTDGTRLDFDLVSIDVGSTPPTAGVDGAPQYAVAAKPFISFARRWDRLIATAEAGELRHLVVVGAGAAGLELVLAMQYRFTQTRAAQAVRYAVVTDAPCLLPESSSRARVALERVLAQRGIAVYLNSPVTSVESDAVILSGSTRVASDATIWATGAAAPAWLTQSGLALDARGFIRVDGHLASVSDPAIFAAGDCASMEGQRYPKSGVYAVRQGPVLAENLRRALNGERLSTYRPQTRALALISTGNRNAVASYGWLMLEGAPVWRWKDYIDRKFMRRYRA